MAGADMFKRQYGTEMVDTVILCEEGDPAPEWACQRRGIRVQIVEEIDEVIKAHGGWPIE